MNMKKVLAIMLMFAVLFMCVLTINVKASNEVVEPDGTNPITTAISKLQGDGTETISLKEGATYEENVEIVKSVTIDGNGATIDGKINITANNSTIVLKNATVKCEEGKPITLLNVSGNGNTVEVENVTFEGGQNAIVVNNLGQSLTLNGVDMSGFYGKAVYSDSIKNLTITNSTFDASGTINAGDHTNEDSKRAGSAIDLNFGNTVSGVEVDKVQISNNNFSNVKLAAGETLEQSTAGAIKIKIKNSDNVKSIGNIVIENNNFADNLRDIVIGTQSVSAGTPTDSAAFNIVLSGNTRTQNGEKANEVKVTNNTMTGTEEERTETIPADVRTTKDFSAKVTIKIGDKTFELTKGTTLSELDLSDIKTKQGYTFKNFVIEGTDTVVSETQGLIANMTLVPVFEKVATEEPNANEETNTTIEEETTEKNENEENIENPQTGDAIILYTVMGLVAIIGIAFIVKKIKK